MIIKNFDNLFNAMCEKLNSKGFSVSRPNCETALFYNEKIVYKIELCREDCKVYLYYQNKDENKFNDDWNRVATWLFEDTISMKDINMICADFTDVIYHSPKVSSSYTQRKKGYSDKGADALFLANRLANIFPELRKEIFIEKEAYSEFRGSVFIKENILPKIIALFSENNSDKRLEKLFKLLSDLYKSSSLNIRSLITMGIMNEITEDDKINKVKKYISEDFCNAWFAAQKFKNENFSINLNSKKKFLFKN